ncbi:hypothetical protein O0L34_g11205 [Tuta absoluta]|nr:hypothetical protein O0L34_g11205 [Tuta absoluta]
MYLPVEEDYVPWEAAAAAFGYLSDMLMGTMAYDDLQKYIQTLVKPLYEKQNWENPPQGVIERLKRVRILSLATRSRLPDAQKKVRTLFLNWLNNHGTSAQVELEPDIRELVYNHGMKSATLTDWEKLWQVYLKEEDAQEQTKLRKALAAPRDSDILRRYLLLAWDEKNIRSQDYLNVIQLIAMNPSGAAIVWDDVRSRWPQFVERFTLNSRYLGNMIPGITYSFNTELKLKEMEAFFSEYPEAGAGEAARRRALETVRNNIRWMQTNQQPVTDWLNSHTT